jgi:hypothetical protein
MNNGETGPLPRPLWHEAEGDPLSPYLFKMAPDPVLQRVETGMPARNSQIPRPLINDTQEWINEI